MPPRGSLMPDRLIVSDGVRELLGDDRVAAISQNDPEYRCSICRVHGDFRHEDTSVLVQRHADGQARLLLGHASCIDSMVTSSDEDAPDPSTRDEPEDLIALTSFVGVGGGKQRPYLFVHTRMPYTLMTEHGDSVSPQQAGLLEQGWQLVMGYPEKYSRARGWRVEVDERGRGRVINDAGAVLLDRLPEGTPGAWFNAARRSGAVSVLFGELGLTDARDGEGVSHLVTEACRRGRVVGALVKVSSVDRVPGPVAPSGVDDRTEAEVGREVAGYLEAALRTRADPEGQDHLNQTEPVIALPTRPVLGSFLLEQTSTRPWPALMVDLNDPDEAQAAETLQKFVDAGLNRDLEIGSNMFPVAPDGWGHITWPSQILILAGRDEDGQTRKVLFEPATFPHQWLKGVQTGGPMGSMALIVANLHGRAVTPELLGEVSAAGGLAVCSLAGMLATDPG